MPTIDEFLTLSKDAQEERFKHLLHETILSGVPGVKETAFIMGLSPSTLYSWGSTGSKKIPRPRQLAHLMHLKKNLTVLYFLNELFAHIPFPRPRCLDTVEDIGRHVIQVFKETSSACQAVFNSVTQDSSGGVEITLEKFKEIHRKIKTAHQQLAALEEAARMKLEQGMNRRDG